MSRGNEVPPEDRRVVTGAEKDALEVSVMATDFEYLEAGKKLPVSFDQLELSGSFQRFPRHRAIARPIAFQRLPRVFVLASLDNVTGARERGDEPIALKARVRPRVIEVKVRIDNQRHIVGTDVAGGEGFQKRGGALDRVGLTEFFVPGVADACVYENDITSRANEQAVQGHRDTILVVRREGSFPQNLGYDAEDHPAVEPPAPIADNIEREFAEAKSHRRRPVPLRGERSAPSLNLHGVSLLEVLQRRVDLFPPNLLLDFELRLIVERSRAFVFYLDDVEAIGRFHEIAHLSR